MSSVFGVRFVDTGRIPWISWNDAQGRIRYICEIVAEQVDILANAKEATNEGPKKWHSNWRRFYMAKRSQLRFGLAPIQSCGCSLGQLAFGLTGEKGELRRAEVTLRKWLLASIKRNSGDWCRSEVLSLRRQIG